VIFGWVKMTGGLRKTRHRGSFCRWVPQPRPDREGRSGAEPGALAVGAPGNPPARVALQFMPGHRLTSDARKSRVPRMAARQRFSLISCQGHRASDVGKYALTDVFGDLEPRSRAFGFDERGSPAASLEEIEAYLKEER
jgi:hypothetical protein